MKKFITTAVLATSGLIFAGQASATDAPSKSTTGNFNVKINVLSTCAITADDIVFSDITSNATADDKEGTLLVTCTNKTPYKVSFTSNGVMTHGTDSTATIAYSLLDSSKAAYSESNKFSGEGTGLAQSIPLTARVTGSTNVRAGLYTGAVTATVTY